MRRTSSPRASSVLGRVRRRRRRRRPLAPVARAGTADAAASRAAPIAARGRNARPRRQDGRRDRPHDGRPRAAEARSATATAATGSSRERGRDGDARRRRGRHGRGRRAVVARLTGGHRRGRAPSGRASATTSCAPPQDGDRPSLDRGAGQLHRVDVDVATNSVVVRTGPSRTRPRPPGAPGAGSPAHGAAPPPPADRGGRRPEPAPAPPRPSLPAARRGAGGRRSSRPDASTVEPTGRDRWSWIGLRGRARGHDASRWRHRYRCTSGFFFHHRTSGTSAAPPGTAGPSARRSSVGNRVGRRDPRSTATTA